MKKIISLVMALGLIVLFSPKSALAQMGEAQQIKWDVSKDALITSKQEDTWSLLSELDLVKLFAKDYIKSVEVKGDELPFERIITFVNGSSRTEDVVQVDQVQKFLVYNFAKKSLPAGIDEVSVAVFTKAKGDNTEVKWMARVTGKNEAKKALVAELATELEKYATGLTTLIKNAVPAAVME
ncbi:hypothetical protein [Pedobacter nyackensis]|uniref:hypothetical protein n=1 Tax=Pedobacter nyackensis TaxID=475255 RepID=UPI002931B484|nr:hypothetical protein [Pedobacter nyackensis]